MSSKPGVGMFVSAFLDLVTLSGCSISTNKDSQTGHDKDVDIHTPLGSISVHKGSTDAKDTGLALYPGATPKKDMNDDTSSANVNISSAFFGVKVVALKYQSNDSPDKVLGFYRKEMARYGKVVDCSGSFNMTFHRHDGDSEVTCNDGGSGHEYKEALELGTENNQLIVAVRPNGAGAEV